MNLELKGKVAIVGGGSQGIGYGIARALASEGAEVVITARRETDLRAAVEQISLETRGSVRYIPADCRKSEDCQHKKANQYSLKPGVGHEIEFQFRGEQAAARLSPSLLFPVVRDCGADDSSMRYTPRSSRFSSVGGLRRNDRH